MSRLQLFAASVFLTWAVLAPYIAPACETSATVPPFDGIQCVQLRPHPAAPHSETILINRCEARIAMLVLVCDLAAHPACKADPIASTGWSTRRGVEYVAPAGTNAAPLHTAQRASTPPLRPYAAGLPKGWRAQIAACKLDVRSPFAQNACVQRLLALKRSLDASAGQSMHAVLKEIRRTCSTQPASRPGRTSSWP